VWSCATLLCYPLLIIKLIIIFGYFVPRALPHAVQIKQERIEAAQASAQQVLARDKGRRGGKGHAAAPSALAPGVSAPGAQPAAAGGGGQGGLPSKGLGGRVHMVTSAPPFPVSPPGLGLQMPPPGLGLAMVFGASPSLGTRTGRGGG
jgi:hypothetical protein